jgi:hypothetical protein
MYPGRSDGVEGGEMTTGFSISPGLLDPAGPVRLGWLVSAGLEGVGFCGEGRGGEGMR